ncbi:MAG: type II secretion system protein GspD, partial [Deltaproteobacteria bacterium]|nr:type II secretion system protein GspD [Deltaproteobacteria bacterium]
INAGGLVRLELEQTIRNTGDSVTVGDNNTAPRFDERNIRTTLLAQNGSTVVIGGIIQQKLQETKDGIPGLQNVPILGSLFANTSKSNDRTELIIAITPHVVDQRENNTTREFLRRLKDLKIRAEQGRT